MTRFSELVRREPGRRLLTLPTWLEHVAAFGITTKDREEQRRQRIVNVAAYVAAGTRFSHVAINALHDARGPLVVRISNAVFALLPLVVPTLHRFGENAAAIALATLVGLGTGRGVQPARRKRRLWAVGAFADRPEHGHPGHLLPSGNSMIQWLANVPRPLRRGSGVLMSA
jgi:hypothetical protein